MCCCKLFGWLLLTNLYLNRHRLRYLSHPRALRFGFDFLNSPSSSPFLDSVTQNLKDRVIPQHLSNLEKLVGGNGWLGGDWEEPTVADFNFGVRLEYLNNLQELDR